MRCEPINPVLPGTKTRVIFPPPHQRPCHSYAWKTTSGAMPVVFATLLHKFALRPSGPEQRPFCCPRYCFHVPRCGKEHHPSTPVFGCQEWRKRVADIFICNLILKDQKLRSLVQHDYHRDAAFCVQSPSADVCHHCYFGLIQRLRARDLSRAHCH